MAATELIESMNRRTSTLPNGHVWFTGKHHQLLKMHGKCDLVYSLKMCLLCIIMLFTCYKYMCGTQIYLVHSLFIKGKFFKNSHYRDLRKKKKKDAWKWEKCFPERKELAYKC